MAVDREQHRRSVEVAQGAARGWHSLLEELEQKEVLLQMQVLTQVMEAKGLDQVVEVQEAQESLSSDTQFKENNKCQH